MALASLVPHHIFGLRGKLKDALQFVDDTTVIYPAGHNIVLWSIDQKTQKIISGTPDTDGITAFALSPSKRQVAIAERAYLHEKVHRGSTSENKSPFGGDGKDAKAGTAPEIKYPVINLYDTTNMKKKKVLAGGSEVGAREYVSIAFTSDGRMIAAQGGGPDWNLIVWSLEKSKIIATTKSSSQGTEAYQVQCCPANPSIITVIGVGFARTFRATDTTLKPISTGIGKKENLVFICHTWLADKKDGDDDIDDDKDASDKIKDGACIYAINNGEILYVDGGEIVATIVPGDAGAATTECIVQYSKGFVCGEAGGIISVFGKQEGEEINYKKTHTLKMDNTGAKVCSMALSPNEDFLLCTMDSQQLLSLPFQNIDMFKPDEVPKELLVQAFHSEEITGMDMCIRRPIIATCGTDKSVRVWNYIDKCCELAKFFTEEALSISLHPNGLHVLVGFSDKLRMMNVLMDDIRMAKEFNIKGCGECVFSTGGQYFAAVHSNAVHVFETYTCVNLGNLRAHSGKVRSIAWSYDDNYILTAGMDGSIYEWEFKDLKRVRENVIKGCIYTSVVSVKDSKTFFAVGSDRKLKELDTLVIKSYTSAYALTQIALPFGSRLLFAGTEIGSVRAYRFPLSGDYYEVRACSASISRICVSCDATLLACAGEDGVLMLFDIRDKERTLTQGAAKKDKDALGWAHEVLVSRADVEEMRQSCLDLEAKIAELTTYCDYELKMKEEETSIRIKTLTDSFVIQLDESRVKMETILQQKAEEELEVEQKQMQLEETHAQALLDVEEQYQKKMMVEVARYTSLLQEKMAADAKWKEETAILLHGHERALQELIEAYEEKLEGEKVAFTQLKQDKEQATLDFAEIQRQHEEDQDREIEDTKAIYEAQLTQEKEILLGIKGENGIMKKKFLEFQKEIEEQREEIKMLFQQKKELYDIIAIFERDMTGLKKDIQERDETIGEKEKRIYELKRKNQELEKFKFVLDFKIKELKQQIEPREVELQQSKETIRKMEIELGRSHSGLAKKDLLIAELRLKLDGMNNEEVKLRRIIADVSATLKHFQYDFYELPQFIQDPGALKAAVIEMFEKYVENKVTITAPDEDVQAENARQREFLERTVAGLQRKLSKEVEMNHLSHVRIMEENVGLIRELNDLRRENKMAKLSQKGASSSIPPRADDEPLTSGWQDDIDSDAKVALEIKQLKSQIQGLHSDLVVKQDRITYLEKLIQEQELIHPRPHSRNELPPMAGASGQASPQSEQEQLSLPSSAN